MSKNNKETDIKNPMFTALITGCFNGLIIFIFSQFIKWDCIFCILISNIFSLYIMYSLFKVHFRLIHFLRFNYALIIGTILSSFTLSSFSQSLYDIYFEFSIAVILIDITINGVIYFIIRSQLEKETTNES